MSAELTEDRNTAIWEKDLHSDTVKLEANDQSIFGYQRDEVSNHLDWWRERVHPADLPNVERITSQAIDSGAPGWSTEYRFRRKDGSWAWIASSGVIQRDAEGRARRLVGAMIDITGVRNEEKVRAGQMLLQRVLDNIPVGVAVLDRAGDILLHNPAFHRLWGTTIVAGEERWARSTALWHESGKRVHAEEWASKRALETGEISGHELLDIEASDGERKTIENYAAPIRDATGVVTGALVVNEDVTERVRAEEALRKTERLLSDAEKLGRIGSWEQDLISGQMFNTRSNLRLFFGDDRSKGMCLEDYVEAIDPRDRNRVITSREQLHAGTGSGDIEFRVIWPDGSVHWIFGRATIVRDSAGRPLRAYGTNADITDRKFAEEELERRARQLEVLSRQLIAVQESERRAVARELHDDFGQVLTALKINLLRTGRDEAENVELVDGALARMRDLAHNLRPPLLDELGLEASLTWYAEREAKRAGLALHLDLVPISPRPEPAIEITCFRVTQEALTNVIRHAHAQLVRVELTIDGDALELTVSDDGRGFDVPAARKCAVEGGSQGLLSMAERVALAGGNLAIDSAPGGGTRIRARVPLTPSSKTLRL